MKLFLITSKYCYDQIKPIADELQNIFGYEVIYPNSYENPNLEFEYIYDKIEHRAWKMEMFKHSIKQIEECDAVLVLNIDIPIRINGYIGGATMLEMYEAFRQNKKVYVYNELPTCSYKDELNGLVYKVIYQDLNLIESVTSPEIIDEYNNGIHINIKKLNDTIDNCVDKDIILISDFSNGIIEAILKSLYLFEKYNNGGSFEYDDTYESSVKNVFNLDIVNNDFHMILWKNWMQFLFDLNLMTIDDRWIIPSELFFTDNDIEYLEIRKRKI